DHIIDLDFSDHICYLCFVVSHGRAADKPQTRTAYGGGSSSGEAPGEVTFDRAPESPLGQTFAGWITLSDLISPSNPTLSDTMRALAAMLRAGIEYHTARRFNEIRSVLQDSHIPAYSMRHIERFFLSGHLRASPGEMAELSKQYFAELTRSGAITRKKPLAQALLASVNRYGRQAIRSEGTQRDILPGLAAELPGHIMPATQFRVVASLELRKLAGDANVSIWCRKPLRWRGDSLVSAEHTYTQRDVCGLSNSRFRGRLVKEEYRSDIDEILPLDFMESV